mmetsp:Transcript_9067/g.55306  ORF Transcript_9067/g.55306 Transcript_9067/m.55306 type:complete len:82 (+) Transcript_9067:325-570(+)
MPIDRLHWMGLVDSAAHGVLQEPRHLVRAIGPRFPLFTLLSNHQPLASSQSDLCKSIEGGAPELRGLLVLFKHKAEEITSH